MSEESPPAKKRSAENANQGHLCLGIDHQGNLSQKTLFCGDNEALYGSDDPAGDKGGEPNGSKVAVFGICCPLPFGDVLTDQQFYGVTENCPENAVVTSLSEGSCGNFCTVRCTAINTAKYKLGPERHGALWGGGGQFYGGVFRGADIGFDEIPAAIRYSFGRSNQFGWDEDGCIGLPPGSLLTGKQTRRCSGYRYRELLYLDGTPVVMFPKCSKLSNPEDPNATCIP